MVLSMQKRYFGRFEITKLHMHRLLLTLSTGMPVPLRFQAHLLKETSNIFSLAGIDDMFSTFLFKMNAAQQFTIAQQTKLQLSANHRR
jgi:hypothetical protein